MGRAPTWRHRCGAGIGAWLLAGCTAGVAFDGARQASAPAVSPSPSPMPVPAPGLLPGAAALLGLQQIGDAAAALQRSFDDPITVQLRPGAGAAPSAPVSATPVHCKALLDLQPRISGTAQPADWNVLQQRLADCQALRWLAGAATARHSALPADWRSARDTALWPAALWPAISADEVAALARPGQTLRTASQRPEWQPVDPAAPPAMQLQAEGYVVQIQWLAQGDFDGDGWQDWLLRWQARVADGTWRASRCWLVSRQTGQVLHVLKPAEPQR